MLSSTQSPTNSNRELNSDQEQACVHTKASISSKGSNPSIDENNEPVSNFYKTDAKQVVQNKVKTDQENVKEDTCKSYIFKDLGIKDFLFQIIEKKLGFTTPTNIQIEAIPYALKERDVLGIAHTGSGKTLAFGLPIIQNLIKDKKRQFYALILAPTRDLAIQITETLKIFTDKLELKVAVLVGGTNMASQALLLAKRPHIIVGTPGRVCDHLENTKGFHLKMLKYMVLDEGDKLLDLDFDNSLDKILKLIENTDNNNDNRTTMLFSATMTSKVIKLQKISLKNPVKIQVSSKYTTVNTLMEYYVFLPLKYKECYLVHILNQFAGSKVICFVRACEQSKRFVYFLQELKIQCMYLNGNLKMIKRIEVINKFKQNSKSMVLVATDVASRGLDMPNVDLVINYDLPDGSKTYIHRVGRTARAGKYGKAISFVTQYDIEHIQRIEHVLGKKLDEYELNREECILLMEKIYEAKRLAAIKIKDENLMKRNKRIKVDSGHNMFMNETSNRTEEVDQDYREYYDEVEY